MSFNIKKVIITGISGFIGNAVARSMLNEGIEVYGVTSSKKNYFGFENNCKFHKIVCDFNNYRRLHDLIIASDIDVFLHFAWAGGFTTAIKDYYLQLDNAKYAADAINEAIKIGCKKFVYAATYNEFEIANFLNNLNTFKPRYTCIYSTGKTAADLLCRTFAENLGIEYISAHIPMPYGKNNFSKQLVNVVIASLLNGISPKLVEGNNLYDIVYIDDIARAFMHISNSGINKRAYYVGHRKLKTLKELIINIRDIIAPNVKLKFGEYKDNQNIDYSKIDLDLLYNDTGFECISDFEQTIKETAMWVKDNIQL